MLTSIDRPLGIPPPPHFDQAVLDLLALVVGWAYHVS